MGEQDDALERAADELYGLPPDEFTAARDELVKRLRADKQRELANEVKALRRPTVAAWALNQLVRGRRKDVEQLLAAGATLREAQEELVAGGDRSGFQSAVAEERELVTKLARDAVALAGEAGVGSSQGFEEKLVATLHAAALDEETAAELGAGRVLRERQAVAGFGGLDMGAAPAKPAPKAQDKGKMKAKAKPRKEDAAESKRAEEEQARAREALSAARLEERRTGREHDAARKAATRAAQRAAKAEERAAEAARKLDDARAELEQAEELEREAGARHDEAVDAAAEAERELG